MTSAMRHERLAVDWASAGAALEGEVESGDVHVVAGFDGGVLVGVIDGLGHGPEAAEAAREAARILEELAGEPLSTLVEQCHEALRKTRGAVMTLASFDERASMMTWMGVGNVEAILLRSGRAEPPAREGVALRGGVVGYHLPTLRESSLPVSYGDTLVLATDGIRSGFVAGLPGQGTPQEIADAVLARYARGSDDALVVVARYLGGTP
ncbi:MAG TPA: SpoIIE family protein phosphatase [Anaeromyxobacteraceae bacterium]|nr:SpoIIE family protein phosphatase [Anaeromyxobacteraceae bacterium]